MSKRDGSLDTCCSIFPGRKTCPLCGDAQPMPWLYTYTFPWDQLEAIASDPTNEWQEDAILALMEEQLRGASQ
jgi:hypothetical protein